MKKSSTLGLTVAALALLAPLAAHAADVTRPGWYVGGGGMAVFQQDADSEVGGVTNTIEHDLGWGALANGGYAWGNGVRTEGEVAYRLSDVDSVTGAAAGAAGGSIQNWSFMGNVLYDFTGLTILPLPVTPYVGLGVGAALVDADDIRTVAGRTLDSQRLEFAYQGIAGVAAALDKNWGVTADYRYFRTLDPKFKSNLGDRAETDNASHNVMIGLRYTFDVPEAPMAPVAQPAPAPAPVAPQAERPAVPAVPQSYMVFFDFDKASLTPEAQRIVASAAQDYKNGRYVRIVVTGHTDTMGKPAYNQRLSERRAAVVRQEFARLGVPAAAVQAVGVGENGLLVPTNDQVREAQNRRAEIVFNK